MVCGFWIRILALLMLQSITEECERHSDLASDLARRAQHIETLKGHKMALKEYLPYVGKLIISCKGIMAVDLNANFLTASVDLEHEC
jgi:hypothetical protein